jgi:hypothetical protein
MDPTEKNERIEKARQLAQQIEVLAGIHSCQVDDWDQPAYRFTLYANLILPKYGCDQKRYDMRSQTRAIRAVLKPWRNDLFPPKRIYVKDGRRNYCVGYAHNRIEIELVLG